jgi:hypothetical protein
VFLVLLLMVVGLQQGLFHVLTIPLRWELSDSEPEKI